MRGHERAEPVFVAVERRDAQSVFDETRDDGATEPACGFP